MNNIRSKHPKHRALSLGVTAAALCVFAAAPLAAAPAQAPQWGSFLTPFSATSPWNSRPIEPVFGTFVIPTSDFFPTVGGGAYSTGMFLAKEGDPAVEVTRPGGKAGVWDPDAETMRESVLIPRWPAGVIPAAGLDGHADIVDPVKGVIHSFFQLRQEGGQWVAKQYAWTRLDGSGWGDPAHYFQGARAAAVPAAAGLIRKHEIDDGLPGYRHALAMSLTYNALSPKPAYIFPATSADTGAEKTNSGDIPEGALMMLPPAFNTAQIGNAALRKVAQTLKSYGAYVVDRNVGTPFVIYVENGAPFSLHPGGWDNAVAADLQRIRAALRQVVSVQAWVDGNGTLRGAVRKRNILSMRGPWLGIQGRAAGRYDTATQSIHFADTGVRQVQVNDSSRGLTHVSWALPRAGQTYRVAAAASGGAALRLQLRDKQGAWRYDSGELGDGEARQFVWPDEAVDLVLQTISGVGQASTVRASLLHLTP